MVKVSVPQAPPLTIKDTVYNPGFWYTWEGFRAFEDAPSPKFQVKVPALKL
jgi:hypothetical protein